MGLMENAGLGFKGPVKKKRLENEGTENEGPYVRGGKRGNWKKQDIHKEYNYGVRNSNV